MSLTRRLFLTTTAGSAAVLTLAACGGSSDSGDEVADVDPSSFEKGSTMAKLADAGKITIGTKFDQPLFGQAGPDGDPVGFDVEIGKMVAAALGIKPDGIEWTETVTANREPFIENGQVDIVVATYTINDERKKVVDFAGPYYVAGQALMVKKGDDAIGGPDDLKDTNVCSVEGSTPAQNIEDNYPDAKLVTFDTYSKCVTALNNGQADSVTTDNVILAGFVKADEDKLQMVDKGKTFTKEPYGIGLKKDDDDFRAFINDTLQKAYDDGSWAKAWESTAGQVLPTPEPPTIDKY
ncbi:ABC transporter substrate-binding protein [Brachybacterium endophyticum]|uniref:ABC transporter substrate-binding protein n=1 Tax=Brachybacterium endophyticum TaxID=2182385 RepID=A0A2U2RLL2_9MICO|nr:glutamate ABC transporter substrate-binding protein [Brachybacterium endophyticum]PWH06767.1 ABC transporter substrate-binding protein [Brachybacterium endophyticum]